MFKLLKDLTRAPEPLTPSPSPSVPSSPNPSALPYVPRGRSRANSAVGPAQAQAQAAPAPASPTPLARGGPSASARKTGASPDSGGEDVVETHRDAVSVVEGLKKLRALSEGDGVGSDMMLYVEALAQIQAVPSHAASRRAFWRHYGLAALRATLGALAFRPRPAGKAGDEWQVTEVQRVEAARLALELLGAMTTDRPDVESFEKKGGYLSLLPAIHGLSRPRPEEGPGNAGVSTSRPRPLDGQVLGLLLAHILSNNYALLSLFADLGDMADVEQRLGSDLVLRSTGGLKLLWAYLWDSDHGTSGSTDGRFAFDWVAAGQSEGVDGDDDRARLVELSMRVLLAAAGSSTANLLVIHARLPGLTDFLCTRLYGPEPKRHYETTFPAREDWYAPSERAESPAPPAWRAPLASLRGVYLALLRRMLEAGVSQAQAWRLFSLLKLAVPSPAAPAELETLNAEVLETLQLAMRAKWPDAFVFRGGKDHVPGGLQISDLGRPWMPSAKGFMFSCWVYIAKLNEAITLLHLSQKDVRQPLLRIRILENSQIGIFSSVHQPAGPEGGAGAAAADAEAHDVICAAPDALVPHHQWVHFAVGCRRGRGSSHADARIFVDGKRVGGVRIPYPTPAPATAPTTGGKPPATEGIRVSIGSEMPLGTGAGEGAATASSSLSRSEDDEWMLGRTLLLEETVSEDIVMLMHHLGPRYAGNLQEPAGKFLTYEGATSINIYLSAIAQSSAEKQAVPLLPPNSILVRAIRQGPAIAEENVVVSLSAKDELAPSDARVSPRAVMNAAVPHITRTRAFRHGVASLTGHVFAHAAAALDENLAAVGGGVVALKLVDMAKTPAELVAALTILRDMMRDSWAASEEMERIHGFELLAAILRPKMVSLVDIDCAKIILSMLGISVDKPASATVHNSAAYRAIGLEFEMWSYAPLGVVSLYFQHFDYLLSTSKFKRFNLLRTFQKSGVVRKLLYAIRSGMFDPAVVPVAVDALKLILISRWSSEDGLKPVFSYLVSALCQGNASAVIGSTSDLAPTPTQLPAAIIFSMIAELLHNPARLAKLNKSLSLHRLLVIFLSSNPAAHVAIPSLDIIACCLTTPGLEGFQRSFEAEGGFALLARTLAPLWNAQVQEKVVKMLLGKEGATASHLACPAALPSLTSALDYLLQAAGEGDMRRPSLSRTVTGTTLPGRLDVTPMPSDEDVAAEDDRLELLLDELTRIYRVSAPFRKALSSRRIETMLPTLADFAAVSAASPHPDLVRGARRAAAEWLDALLQLGKMPSNQANQVRLIAEQLRTSLPSPHFASSPALGRAPVPSTPRQSGSFLGTSVSSRFGSSPTTAFNPTSSSRRRPSTDGGLALYRTRSGLDKRAPAPLKRVLTGESILAEEKDKNSAWKMIILQTDAQRHATMTLERKEHWDKLANAEWPRQVAALRAENGIWAEVGEPVTWRLDGSEGPLRMRARLERINAIPEQGMAKTRQKLRDAIPSADELSSAVSRMNAAPWEDPFALALGDAAPIAEEEAGGSAIKAAPSQDGEEGIDNDYVDVEDEKADKMRRVAKSLEAGDVVEENIVRIVGVDALPGLMILGKRNLYLIDGLVQTPEGQVIEASQAPPDVLSIPSGTLVELDESELQNQRWPYNDVIESNKRHFLFRDVALELYFADKQNFLVVFRNRKQRQGVVQRLAAKVDHRDAISRSVIGNFVLDTVARAIDKSEGQLESMTRRWQNREISNFAYLQLLNQHANRTPNDVTQYPVFPWVLSDYTSQLLDLNNPASFRDLNYPMGALTETRREAAAERYSATEGVGEKPFHYGTHYTSSMIVCGFMIRLSPFTEIFLALQGGNFDLADRLFSSIPRAWESASNDNRGDVRELIPEFFYSPGFLVNVNHHDFGRKQVSGDAVDDVVLPPWALGDPLLFTHLHREALESDYISRNLPHWIDLTFGCKQRDPASYNCFHPLSYRGAVDLEQMEDDNEKAASTAIIHNFGQTPLQIFRQPHPYRIMSGKTGLPLGTRFGVAEHWQLLIRSILPITETTSPIDGILNPISADAKPATQQRYRLVVPGRPALSVQFGFADMSLRVYYQDSTPRLVCIVEGIQATHAVFAAPTLLVTVAPSGIVTAWRIGIKGSGSKRGDVTLQREATLRGHTRPVTCLAVSEAWSLLVTGSEDGTALVWDMNRLRYIRTLQTPSGEPIKYTAVHEADGQVVLATARRLFLFTLNGHPIASASVDSGTIPLFSFGHVGTSAETDAAEYTGGISFLTREFVKGGNVLAIGIGTELALYRCAPGRRRRDDEEIPPWRLLELGRLDRSDDHVGAEPTAVRFIGETLYAAFKPGESAKHSLYQWSLPETNQRHVPESVAPGCMAESCTRQFGLLEPRRHCGGCGGLFCGSHAVHVESFNQRHCEQCRLRLAHATALGVLAPSRRGSGGPHSAALGGYGQGGPGATASGAASRRGSLLVLRDAKGAGTGLATPPRAASQPPSRSSSGTSMPTRPA
ncbi:Beige protein-like 1 [Cryptotrichosporon argae]